ncbi:MAG: SgcJ/EcaC family oxidoreductase [Pseudomonadota bacterium]
MSRHYLTGDAVARAFFDAWNARDADALAALFAEDADFVNVVGLWWTSARQIRKAHDYGFRRIFQNAVLEITELKVRELTPDIQLVHTVSTLDGQTATDGTPTAQRIAVISMVAVREGGSFRIVSCHNTDRVEGADTHVRDTAGFRSVSYRG